jgi:hypothetical protein
MQQAGPGWFGNLLRTKEVGVNCTEDVLGKQFYK